MIGGYDRGEIISPTRVLRLCDVNGSTDSQQHFMENESPKLSKSVDVGQGDRNGQVSVFISHLYVHIYLV